VERIVPAEQHGRQALEREDAQRELLRLATRSVRRGHRWPTSDYYRMPVREAHPRIAELVEAGDLLEARVEALAGGRLF